MLIVELQNGVEFPAVTICNLNYIQKRFAEEEDPFVMDVLKTIFPITFIPPPLDLTDPEVLEKTKGR